MAQMQIRGSTQIMDATVTAAKLVTSLNLATSQLADGALFIKKDGTVTLTASLNFGGFTGISVADPVNPQDIANYRTVQSLVNGIAIKASTKAVAIANITLTGTQTIDGVTLVATDRVLLTAQTTPAQNGIWLVQAGAWTRSADWTAASVQKEGIMVLVAEGTIYHDTKWLCITDGVITVDTTSTVWNQDLSGIAYTNGSGLSLTGSAFAVKNGNGIAFDGSNNITVNPNGTSLNVSATGVKISDGTGGQIVLAGASGAAAMTSITGDVTFGNTGITTVNITSGTGFLKYGVFVFNETPTGVVNGSNTAFTLAFAPASSSQQLFLNGQLLEPGAGNDYTIATTAVTMLFAPIAGDKLRVNYIK